MGRHVAGQLVRSGTSPAPNYEEGCAAESRADFIHKLSICLKELRESRCWIRLIIKTEMLPEHKMGELLDECNQLCNIIGQSVVTAKKIKPGRQLEAVNSLMDRPKEAICILRFAFVNSQFFFGNDRPRL